MIPQKYKDSKKGNPLDKMMYSVQMNRVVTHAAKIMEPFCDFVVLCDEVRKPLEFNYLCTANCGSDKLDISTKNAANKAVQGFLSVEVKEKDNKTIRDLFIEDDPDLREEIENEIGDYETMKKAVLYGIKKADTPRSTDGFLRQVYFPVKNDYHLLSIMPSSILVDRVSRRLAKSSIKSKMRTYVAPPNTVNTMGSMMMSKNPHPFVFVSLPPVKAKKTLRKALVHEYLIPDFRVDELAGVRNGMLVDGDKLDVIINEGIRKGEGNWHRINDRAERNPETITTFRERYGYECIPDGYEVHHIVPIAQGGADVVENMILLTKEDHEKVTNKHKEVFKWNT